MLDYIQRKNSINIKRLQNNSIILKYQKIEKTYLLNFIFVILYYVPYEVAYYFQLYSFIRQTMDDY